MKTKAPSKRELKLAAELKDLQKRMGKDVIEDLQQFKLVGTEMANATHVSEHYAGSNLGFKDRHDLQTIEQEVDVGPEVRAWRRVIDAAIELCAKYKLEPTNANVLLLSHHPKAHKAYNHRNR